jgi:hypothetical protein
MMVLLPIDLTKVSVTRKMAGDEDGPEEEELLQSMLMRATAYLESFKWCKSVKEKYYGIGVGKIFAVFLYHIIPTPDDIDEWIWVVVGDLPSAYLGTGDFDLKNPAQALDGYIGAMRQWVEAVKNGESIESLIPVNVPPKEEWARNLERRLDYLDNKVLHAHYDDDL